MVQGLCERCKTNKQENKGKKYGYRKICGICYKAKRKGDSCEGCSFVAKHSCQLDIHHIDENHFNNDPTNLQTLCANCHRLRHSKNFSGIF